MPVKRVKTKPEKHPGLVKEIRRVLRKNSEKGSKNEPQIIIEDIRFSNNVHVTVIWDRWEGIELEERGRIILAAFGEELGEAEMLRVSLAMGLTTEEAARLKIGS